MNGFKMTQTPDKMNTFLNLEDFIKEGKLFQSLGAATGKA